MAENDKSGDNMNPGRGAQGRAGERDVSRGASERGGDAGRNAEGRGVSERSGETGRGAGDRSGETGRGASSGNTGGSEGGDSE